MNQVKLTFLEYPYTVKPVIPVTDTLLSPDVLTLSSLKAYALGRRSKWKDYVDLYFILQQHTLEEVVKNTILIFNGEFNEKLFREQLCYFDDIDYTEQVDFMTGFEKTDEEIKQFLCDIATK